MTIVVSLQCSEGMVLAADSAITVHNMVEDADGETRLQTYVWPHAKKLYHIGDLLIGTLSWGIGTIGERNIQSLLYQFEVERLGQFRGDQATVPNIAGGLYAFLHEKHHEEYHDDQALPLGMIVAGYSPGSFVPEQYRFVIPINKGPIKLRSVDNLGLYYEGQPDAIMRLINGIDPALAIALSMTRMSGATVDEFAEILNRMTRAPAREALDDLRKLYHEDAEALDKFYAWRELMAYDVLRPGMPLQDGIDLATWLIDVTSGRFRFAAEHAVVGGAIDIAVITHNSYTWIQRKSWHGYERTAVLFNRAKEGV